MNNKKDVIKRYSTRLWEQHDFTAIDELFLPDAVIHSPLNRKKGRCTMREIAQKWLQAFPDLYITWGDFIAEEDKVVSRWQAHGTHLGGFFETSPTHREISYTGITIYTFDQDKVCEYWALVDMHAILGQLQEYDSISEVVE